MKPKVVEPGCPVCGAILVMRTIRASGGRFLGCMNYPGCDAIRQGVNPEMLSVDPKHRARGLTIRPELEAECSSSGGRGTSSRS